MNRLFNSLYVILLVVCGAAWSAPQVVVDGEELDGVQVAATGVAVFRGIPFAEPPVGELRWQAPKPLSTNRAHRDTTKFAPACMQTPRILDWYRDLAETFGASRDVFEDLETSEDCLYLNIWTPRVDASSSLPVMVYVHGGSNNSGWAYEPNYHGHALAERGVVVVSIAYRLGVFGFLSHPDLDPENGLANFALWDQLAALEWVQRNIDKFGGDPGRVTVFGESAGAQDILALMATGRARGLIHGAILQSNAGFGIGGRAPASLEAEQQRGIETAKIFGFTGPGTLNKLREVSAEDLLEKYDAQFPHYYHSPATDGQLLTNGVWDAISEGDLLSVPLIIGTNADERYPSDATQLGKDDIQSAIESSQFLNSPESYAAVIHDPDPANAVDRISTADGMQCPSQYLAANQSAAHDNGWVYYFSRIRDGSAGAEVRAYHGAELPYVFGSHDPWMTTTDTDWALAEQMMSYWIRFAKTGNPNSDSLPEWPAFRHPNGKTMEFANHAVQMPAQEPVLCRVFRETIGSR